jgi:hypothetical protein
MGLQRQTRLKKNWDDHLEYAGHEKEKRNAVALICFYCPKNDHAPVSDQEMTTMRWHPAGST